MTAGIFEEVVIASVLMRRRGALEAEQEHVLVLVLLEERSEP